MIFQRIGARAIRLLWAFAPNVRLDARLRFYDTARRTISTTFERAVHRRVNEAFARHG